eukprot:SAG31_NODE_2829_length_5028_cov_2.496652_1_plen_182_part_00
MHECFEARHSLGAQHSCVENQLQNVLSICLRVCDLIGLLLLAAPTFDGQNPTGRVPHLQVGGSPWVHVHGGDAAINRSIEAAEIAMWTAQFSKTAQLLKAANQKFGTNLVIGAVTLDVESWSWSPNYAGVPGKQDIIDGIRRKSELIFNLTKTIFPVAQIIYYDYGASYWRAPPVLALHRN